MSKDQKGFVVYGSIKEVIDELPNDQVAQLFRGMVDYFVSGKAPKFTGVLKLVFIPIKQQMDRDMEKYDAKCEKNRKNIQNYWDKVKSDTNEYVRIRSNTIATNTNTNTNTNTKTNTDTTTTTNTKARGGGDGDDSVYKSEDEYNIWKKLTPEDVDTIYASYPNSGGDLIQAVYEDAKKKRRKVGKAVPYILGYADRVLWDDNADHGGVL